MHHSSNNVRVRASHQDEFPTLDDVTVILMSSPATVRGWRHGGIGPNLLDLKPAREQTRTGFAA